MSSRCVFTAIIVLFVLNILKNRLFMLLFLAHFPNNLLWTCNFECRRIIIIFWVSWLSDNRGCLLIISFSSWISCLTRFSISKQSIPGIVRNFWIVKQTWSHLIKIRGCQLTMRFCNCKLLLFEWFLWIQSIHVDVSTVIFCSSLLRSLWHGCVVSIYIAVLGWLFTASSFLGPLWAAAPFLGLIPKKSLMLVKVNLSWCYSFTLYKHRFFIVII